MFFRIGLIKLTAPQNYSQIYLNYKHSVSANLRHGKLSVKILATVPIRVYPQ